MMDEIWQNVNVKLPTLRRSAKGVSFSISKKVVCVKIPVSNLRGFSRKLFCIPLLTTLIDRP